VFFVVKKLITALVLPPTSVLLVAMCGLLMLRWKPRLGRAFAWAGLLTLLALSLPPVSGLLGRLVDDGPPLDLRRATSAQAIVVLAAGLRRNAVEYGGDTVNWLSLERVRYAATLARQTHLPVLITGGHVYGGRAEADLMRDVMESEFGVPVRWVETHSRNTYENAVMTSQILRPAGIGTVLLVTHGMGERHARREFAAAGLSPINAPTVLPGWVFDSPLQLLPSASALALSTLSLYELLGNVATTLGLSGA
jgi:uncharacterized SAM-binding protein YcdF (DUF218 family)